MVNGGLRRARANGGIRHLAAECGCKRHGLALDFELQPEQHTDTALRLAEGIRLEPMMVDQVRISLIAATTSW
jgi:hypothetical protein